MHFFSKEVLWLWLSEIYDTVHVDIMDSKSVYFSEDRGESNLTNSIFLFTLSLF